MAKILIVDDDAAFRGGLSETVRDLGHDAIEASSGHAALAKIESVPVDLIFLDLRMPGDDGLETLKNFRALPECDDVPVIMLTAHAGSDNTIEAMKLGAFDHVTKPIGREDVRAILQRALARPKAAASPENAMLTHDRLLGESAGMREVHKLIGLAATSDATVLIQGETGTGKEEVARAIHRHSARARRAFVAVNCAAIPAELLESELFGHVRGAFTGALTARDGKFMEANGGTIFLDEIGDMALPMQAKILRVLQERVLTPVGGKATQPIDVRVIAATHRELGAMVREKTFREDLFYRLNVVRIALPPLRERGDDVVLLAEYFLRELSAEGAPRSLQPDAIAALRAHDWPGNVRELRNAMQRATVTGRSPSIARDDLALGASASPDDDTRGLLELPLAEAIARLEKMSIARALREANGNRAEAARRLGIHRQLLYAKLKEHFGDEDVRSSDSASSD